MKAWQKGFHTPKLFYQVSLKPQTQGCEDLKSKGTMQPQTLRPEAALSATQCRAVLQIHVSIFEQVGSHLQKPLFKKVSLGSAHGIICALIT